MKVFFSFLLFFLFVFTSCKKDNTTKDTEATKAAACIETLVIQTNIPQSLVSVFFLTGNYGFAAGYTGGIYKSIDSAKTWTTQNSTVNLPIRGLFFIDELKGFAVGGQNSCGGTGCIPPGGFILRTLDGGQTWTTVFTPTDKVEISSVFFVNALTGFCAGDNTIFKTTDGGQTWSEYKVNNLGGKMMQIYFTNAQKGYVICLFDKILITENAGQSWQVASPSRNYGYYSISSSNGSTYVSGQGKVIKSINGGSSWIDLPNSPSDIFAMHFIDDKKGFAFGRGNYSGGDWGHSYGSIYCTNNGGNTWNGSADIKEVGPIQSVSFPANNIGYAVSGTEVLRFYVR